MFATSGVSFLASSYFNLSKKSLLVGAGLPVSFFFLHMLSTSSESLEFSKYFSLNSLFDTSAIIAGDSFGLNFSILAAVGVILYSLSLVVFNKKDLSL